MTRRLLSESGYAEHQAKVRRGGFPAGRPLVEPEDRPALARAAATSPQPKRKYNNEPTVDEEGIRHDSKREAKRWRELRLMLRAGQLRWLARQVEFILAGGVVYRADFQYQDANGAIVIEDAKGVRTPEYKIKKRLMAERGFEIQEV